MAAAARIVSVAEGAAEAAACSITGRAEGAALEAETTMATTSCDFTSGAVEGGMASIAAVVRSEASFEVAAGLRLGERTAKAWRTAVGAISGTAATAALRMAST